MTDWKTKCKTDFGLVGFSIRPPRPGIYKPGWSMMTITGERPTAIRFLREFLEACAASAPDADKWLNDVMVEDIDQITEDVVGAADDETVVLTHNGHRAPKINNKRN